jgi:microcystin-dependent protein
MPIHTHELTGSLTTGSAGSHTHTVTDPGHVHSYLTPAGAPNNAAGSIPDYITRTTTTTSSATTGISINSALDHTHSLTLSGNTQSAGGASGSTQPHENRPPYYALCYIQKMY